MSARVSAAQVSAGKVAAADKRTDAEANEERYRRRLHVVNGWPHLGHAGACLCLDRCCFGVGGCHCRSCSCGGRGHP